VYLAVEGRGFLLHEGITNMQNENKFISFFKRAENFDEFVVKSNSRK